MPTQDEIREREAEAIQAATFVKYCQENGIPVPQEILDKVQQDSPKKADLFKAFTPETAEQRAGRIKPINPDREKNGPHRRPLTR